MNNSINALNTNLNSSIANWVLQDYALLTSDSTSFGASLRYDIKLEKLPAFFISGQWIRQSLQEKNNNFVGVNLGITF